MITSGCYFDELTNVALHFGVFLLTFPILFLKRSTEVIQRPNKVWLMDVSKQVIVFVILNIKFRIHKDFCVGYFVETLIDGVLHTFMSILLLVITQNVIRSLKSKRLRKLESGNYTSKYLLTSWLLQWGIWLVIWLISKFVIIQVVYLWQGPLYFTGSLLLLPLKGNQTIQNIVVLMLIPLIINCSVLWVTDNYLMDSSGLYTLYFRHNSKWKSNESSEASLESLKVLKYVPCSPLEPLCCLHRHQTRTQRCLSTLWREVKTCYYQWPRRGCCRKAGPQMPSASAEGARIRLKSQVSLGAAGGDCVEEKQKQSQGQVVQHVLRETAQSTPVRTTMRKFEFNKEEYYHVSVGLPKAENKEAPPMAISKETAQGLKINRRKTLIKRATVADL